MTADAPPQLHVIQTDPTWLTSIQGVQGLNGREMTEIKRLRFCHQVKVHLALFMAMSSSSPADC